MNPAAGTEPVEQYIHVVGWDRFQHGSTRNNPWIKNYLSQLHKDEYLDLSFHLRGVLHSIRLSYAASDRQLSGNTATLKRQLGQRVTVRDLESLIHAGFLELRASTVLAQNRIEESREETPPTPLLETGPAASVYRTLSAIDKPGYQPPRFNPERLAVLLARFGDVDVEAEAENLADWERFGKGESRKTTDGIRALRNWLTKARPTVPDKPPDDYANGTYHRLTPEEAGFHLRAVESA